jgi:uncharacterized metal-binding protein (TIGR02443 family)
MNDSKATKRFVAGAVCPRCAQMDKLLMYNLNNQQVRECVRCGYKDVMTDSGPQKIDEVKTRVNQLYPGEKPLAHENEVQLINLNGLNSSSKKREH